MIFTLIRIRGWGCLILGDFFFEMRKFFNFCLDNRKQKWYNTKALRGVAQFGRALGSGPRGRKFKSSHSDQKSTAIMIRNGIVKAVLIFYSKALIYKVFL